MPLKMNRGRVGSLFKHMPGQPYNWQGQNGSFIGIEDVNTVDMDVPATWIKRSLLRLVRPFAIAARDEGKRFAGLEIIERGRFKLLEPTRLTGEFFPNTYVCSNCNLFFRSEGDRTRTTCRACGGTAEQWSFVEYHRCGYISGLNPPFCQNRCGKGMKILNRESRSFSEWGWRCAGCGTVSPFGVYKGCKECGNGRVRISRPDANPVYYAQYVTVVNPPAKSAYTLFEAEGVYAAAVAQAMGVLPPGLDGLQQGVEADDSGESLEQARRELLDQWDLDEDDEDDRRMLEKMLEKKRVKLQSRPDWRSEIKKLSLAEEELTELGHQCAELALAREASPVTLEDLVNLAPSATYRAMYEIDYKEALDKYGFAEAMLLREFPMAQVVAGYTRESKEPELGVEFNFFKGSGSSFYMYGQRTETEALFFRLDPARVLRWLVDSGVVDDPGNVEAQSWIFSNTRPVGSIFEPPEHRITAAILGLVHSVAHRTLKAVAVRSGLKPESLSEYLFPHNLAFLVYADTSGEFVLGGLEHVFKNYLAESLNHMDEERRCVFDPPCKNDKGSCAVCMHLSENSCARFNSALSRHYLFGGEHGGVTWKAFWNR